MNLARIVALAPVIPVIVIEDWKAAAPLARTLAAAGLPAIEITLRTPSAMQAIRAICGEVEGAVVGAGTVLTGDQLEDAAEAGARFAVSPGISPSLLAAATAAALPLLPGAATASEAMALFERGYALQKFFPAAPAGGVAYLKALAAPLPDIRFCPTGGVDAGNAASYLALPNVACVGGSWVAPAEAIAGGDWERIGELAKSAAALERRA
jgi:2-dehydro-3-deoxyphosphogluconate aldolase/(4S)-4-hydroxy-2-oxoglutarate aldolase